MLCLWRVTAICADGTCCLLLQAAFLHLLCNSSALFCPVAPSHTMHYCTGRAEDTWLQRGRLAHPCQLDTHLLPPEDGGQERQIALLFGKSFICRAAHFMKNIKQINKKRQFPQLFGSVDLRTGAKNQRSKKPPSAHSAQPSTDLWRTWWAQQQVSLADIITNVSDTAP